MRRVDYFLTMASPWAYLGHATLIDAMRRNGVGLNIRPTPIGRLFSQTGGVPLPQRHPARQLYRLVDLQRWRARLGLPLKVKPAHSPFDATLLDCAVLAALASGADPDPFMRAAFRAVWVEDRDLAAPETIKAVAREAGLGENLVDEASKVDIKALYESNLAEALAAGVFGAPSYVLGGEVFWGQDRIELLVSAIEIGRAPYRPDEMLPGKVNP